MTDRRCPDDPGALLALAWGRLEAAPNRADDPFRTPVLATAGPGGAEARTVILRHADPGGRGLAFYTDARSAKVASLAADPRVAWVFYDPADRVQLRARGRATLHRDGAVGTRHWEAVGESGRRDYLSAGGPGAALAAPGDGIAAAGETLPARANFMVVACTIEHLDWLVLGPPAHRRARFDWDGRAWRHAWITP